MLHVPDALTWLSHVWPSKGWTPDYLALPFFAVAVFAAPLFALLCRPQRLALAGVPRVDALPPAPGAFEDGPETGCFDGRPLPLSRRSAAGTLYVFDRVARPDGGTSATGAFSLSLAEGEVMDARRAVYRREGKAL